ncbi:hypothetical protein BGX31_005755 [Mortierella sp. GBA43]|nr:hypothetical protein BGX31_005755 [Mortierella sp. GBA43]
MLKQQLGRAHAGGPEKSTYSPPAAYSEYPMESYGQQRLNKSGFCVTERWSSRHQDSQLEDWRTLVPVMDMAQVKN